MPEQTDAELVARGMAVVRPMIEDRRRFDSWLRQAALEAQGQGDYGEPSAWQGWRAGKADLAQQVDALCDELTSRYTDAANDGRIAASGAMQVVEEFRATLHSHGAHQAPEG